MKILKNFKNQIKTHLRIKDILKTEAIKIDLTKTKDNHYSK